MDNKYYTPKIEEFHVGFEVEWSESGRKIWINEIFDEDDLSDLCLGVDKISNFRVKFLDREDLESLGWEFVGKDEFFDCINYNIGDGYVLQFWEEGGVSIERYSGFFHAKTIHFAGKIKNKSELVKLMAMLNINH